MLLGATLSTKTFHEYGPRSFVCGFWLPEFATFSRTKGQSQLSAGKQPPYTEQKRLIEMSQFVRKGLLLVPFHRDSRCLMLRVFAPAIT